MARRQKRMTRKQRIIALVAAGLVLLASAVLGVSGGWDELLAEVGLRGITAPIPEGELQIHVIDVGNADSIWITNGGRHLLIDAGEKESGDEVVTYLRGHGVERLDMVIATHADADHIGGMRTVLEAFPADRFLMAFMPEGYEPTTAVYLNLLETLDKRNIAVTEAEPGARYTLGSVRLDILGPAGMFEEKNNQSVVCALTFGERRFLFMGDAEKEAENALLSAGCDLSADWIKLGHHGSSSSSRRAFLERVSPETAVITCGAGNSYGHPHEETLDTLRALDIAWYRSDRDGTIVTACDGKTIRVTTERSGD